jgi:hypothetical protein
MFVVNRQQIGKFRNWEINNNLYITETEFENGRQMGLV